MTPLPFDYLLYGSLARRALPAFGRLSRSDQEAVLRDSLQAPGRGTSARMMAAMFIWAFGTMCLIKAPFTGWAECLFCAGLVPGFPLLLYVLFRLRLPSIRRATAKYLARQGEPICGKCGYDLRGTPEPRCPECGAAVKSPHAPGGDGH